MFIQGIGSAGDFCRNEYGGPAPASSVGLVMDNGTMSDTLLKLDVGFWKTVFRKLNQGNSHLEKAARKLDTVTNIIKVSAES
jgi:hypothetical protein